MEGLASDRVRGKAPWWLNFKFLSQAGRSRAVLEQCLDALLTHVVMKGSRIYYRVYFPPVQKEFVSVFCLLYIILYILDMEVTQW